MTAEGCSGRRRARDKAAGPVLRTPGQIAMRQASPSARGWGGVDRRCGAVTLFDRPVAHGGVPDRPVRDRRETRSVAKCGATPGANWVTGAWPTNTRAAVMLALEEPRTADQPREGQARPGWQGSSGWNGWVTLTRACFVRSWCSGTFDGWLERASGIDQQQDQGPHPRRIRVPFPRRASRLGHARHRRCPA